MTDTLSSQTQMAISLVSSHEWSTSNYQQYKFYFDQTIQILSGFGFCKRQENGLPACDGM
jgi:hypothetical protein